MKTRLTLLYILLGLICIIGVASAQTTKPGFIQLHLQTDKNVKTTVQCIDDAITYSDTTDMFTLILHPNKEYILTFTKQGYITKEVYVSTNNINQYNRYSIRLQASLDKGESNITQLYGALVYDHRADTFVKRKYGN